MLMSQSRSDAKTIPVRSYEFLADAKEGMMFEWPPA